LRVNATLLRRIHLDVAKEKDAVPVPGVLDFRDGRIVDRTRKIDTHDLRAERRIEGTDSQSHIVFLTPTIACKIIPRTPNRIGSERVERR
jgi:hypothetical protein